MRIGEYDDNIQHNQQRSSYIMLCAEVHIFACTNLEHLLALITQTQATALRTYIYALRVAIATFLTMPSCENGFYIYAPNLNAYSTNKYVERRRRRNYKIHALMHMHIHTNTRVKRRDAELMEILSTPSIRACISRSVASARWHGDYDYVYSHSNYTTLN